MKSKQTQSVLSPDTTLARIVSVDRSVAELLASIGLDLSSYENKTLREACAQKQWNEEEVLEWIQQHQYLKKSAREEDHAGKCISEEKDIATLADLFEDGYHYRLRELMAAIRDDLPRVCKVHGNQYPWLKQIQGKFGKMEEDLNFYLKFERSKLFPLARQLYLKEEQIKDGLARSLERSLKILDEDHDKLSRQMNDIQTVSRGFELPEGSCTTLCILFQNFKELFSTLEKYFKQLQKILLPNIAHKLSSV